MKTTGEDMLFEHDPKSAFVQFVAPWPATESRWLRSSDPPSPSSTLRANPRRRPRWTSPAQPLYDDRPPKSASAASCAPGRAPPTRSYVESRVCPTSSTHGRRYGRLPDQLRCIFCGMCIEGMPTRALTMTNDFESPSTREDDIYEGDLLVPLSDGMLDPTPWSRAKNDVELLPRGRHRPPTAAGRLGRGPLA